MKDKTDAIIDIIRNESPVVCDSTTRCGGWEQSVNAMRNSLPGTFPRFRFCPFCGKEITWREIGRNGV